MGPVNVFSFIQLSNFRSSYCSFCQIPVFFTDDRTVSWRHFHSISQERHKKQMEVFNNY